MGTCVENYLGLTIEEVYDVIIVQQAWPKTFTDVKKKEFMESMIKYFLGDEEYEKCSKLQKLIDELED